MTTTYKIPAANLTALKDAIAKINKKVAKLAKKGYAADPVDFRVDEKPVIEGEGEKARVFFNVHLNAAAPVKVAGWTFIATIQHEDGGAIIRNVPGAVAEGELVQFREAKPVCNHCGWERRRNDTFVLRNEAGEFKQVGRNCLSDFFGVDAHDAAVLAECLINAGFVCTAGEDDGFFNGPRAERYFALGHFLAYTAAAIRVGGWLGRAKAREQGGVEATADVAWVEIVRTASKPAFVVTEEDSRKAGEALAYCEKYFEDTDPATLNDYANNVRVVFNGGYVTLKLAGIAASIFVFVSNQQEREAANALRNNEWVGELGKRTVFTNLRCVAVGGGRPYVFTDEAGHTLKAWNPGFACEKDGVYNIKATVVKHDEWKGNKVTMINRPVLATEKDLAPKKERKAKRLVAVIG